MTITEFTYSILNSTAIDRTGGADQAQSYLTETSVRYGYYTCEPE